MRQRADLAGMSNRQRAPGKSASQAEPQLLNAHIKRTDLSPRHKICAHLTNGKP
jgi:hypothetical protein